MGLLAKKEPVFKETSNSSKSERCTTPEAPTGDKKASNDDCVSEMPITLRLTLILLFKGTAYAGVKITFKVTPLILDILLLG
jgi:hypothetical protein